MENDCDVLLNENDLNHFKEKGFLKIEKFLPSDWVAKVIEKVDMDLSVPEETYKLEMNSYKYNLYHTREASFEMLREVWFQNAMTGLTEHELFLSHEICFEIKKNISLGFPWHVGTQSFATQQLEDFGCSLWIPLTPIKIESGGGIAFIPQDIFSGRFIYKYLDEAVSTFIDYKKKRGEVISYYDYLNTKHGVLNSPALQAIFESLQVTYGFELGDAMIFHKDTIHKSIPLTSGLFDTRRAYVMRFMGTDSKYNKKGKFFRDYALEEFGVPKLKEYDKDIELNDGEYIATTKLFDDLEKRILIN